MNPSGLSSAVEVLRGIDLFAFKGRNALKSLTLLASFWLSALIPQLVSAQEGWKSPDWLMTSAQGKDFSRRDYLKIKQLFRSPTLSGEQARQVKLVAHYYLSQLTHDDAGDLTKIVDKFFLSELPYSLTSPAVRQAIMEEVVAKVPDLLTHPNDLVRYNALSMVAQLTVRPAKVTAQEETPSVPFAPAHKLLIQVIKDSNQYLACRILAAKGLTRICRDNDGTLSSPEKSDIAQAVVDTLAAVPPSNEDGIWWFRGKLIETLGSVDRIDNVATNPIVIETLLDIIASRNERFVNRALAAQSITQLPWTASTNVPLITDQIMKLLGELSAAYVKAPTATGMHEPFVRIYLAFRPATTRQAKDLKWGLLYQVTRPGLTAHAEYVKGAWAAAFPILRPFIERGPTPPAAAEIKTLTEWLKKVDPANRRVVPNGKEYSSSPAVVTAN